MLHKTLSQIVKELQEINLSLKELNKTLNSVINSKDKKSKHTLNE